MPIKWSGITEFRFFVEIRNSAIFVPSALILKPGEFRDIVGFFYFMCVRRGLMRCPYDNADVYIFYEGINDNDIHKIVLSYLAHNCFKDTLESFVSCTGMKQPFDHLEDMEKRKRIYNFALDGNTSKAIELTKEFAPGLLEENKDLHFDLLSLHFVELLCSRTIDEALGYAQSNFTPFGKEQKYVQRLEDFMALLAYDEPDKSPMFHLLSSEHRQQVADSLNRAILAHSKLPSHSAMERLIQQTTVVRQLLSQELGKDGHNPFSLKDFLNR